MDEWTSSSRLCASMAQIARHFLDFSRLPPCRSVPLHRRPANLSLERMGDPPRPCEIHHRIGCGGANCPPPTEPPEMNSTGSGVWALGMKCPLLGCSHKFVVRGAENTQIDQASSYHDGRERNTPSKGLRTPCSPTDPAGKNTRQPPASTDAGAPHRQIA